MAEENKVELIKAESKVSVPQERWDEFTGALGAVAEKLGLKHIEPERQIALAEAKAKVTLITANSEAEAARVRARGDADAGLILAEGKAEELAQLKRGFQRLVHETQRTQNNIEAVALEAATMLPKDAVLQLINEDLGLQLFDSCKDRSEEWVRGLFAKILAGELQQKGSFSLRTVNALKTLRRQDAALFTLYCRFVWKADGGPAFVLIGDSEAPFWSPDSRVQLESIYRRERISSLDRLHLQALNLIMINDSSRSLTVMGNVFGDPTDLRYHGTLHRLRHRDQNRALRLPVDFLTDIGLELASIVDASPHVEYESLVVQQIKDWGFVAETFE